MQLLIAMTVTQQSKVKKTKGIERISNTSREITVRDIQLRNDTIDVNRDFSVHKYIHLYFTNR